ncbi:MAG: hypothetical protein IJZ86_05045 [Bacteroides sp.]|nr:hypothetical protein [Bacteroides sp.]
MRCIASLPDASEKMPVSIKQKQRGIVSVQDGNATVRADGLPHPHQQAGVVSLQRDGLVAAKQIG